MKLFDMDIEELEEEVSRLQDLWVWEGDYRAKANLEHAQEILEMKKTLYGEWDNDTVVALKAKEICMSIDNQVLKDVMNLVEEEEKK